MGAKQYVIDQQGIFKRYLNEKSNWDNHLTNCKKYIQNQVEKNGYLKVAILGSGWWLDLPIDFLAKYCERIYLYDIHHPNPIINKAKEYNNVELLEEDLTGGLVDKVQSKLINTVNDVLLFLQNVDAINLKESVQAVFSLNLLNQLDILFIDYMLRFIKANDEEIKQIRQLTQHNHVKFLLTKSAYLISDVIELTVDRNEDIKEEKNLLYAKLENFTKTDEWIWRFDTQKTYRHNKKTFFKVIAGKFN